MQAGQHGNLKSAVELGADAPPDLGGKTLQKVALIRVFGRPPDPLVDAPRIPANFRELTGIDVPI
jgi:hypothetical protein